MFKLRYALTLLVLSIFIFTGIASNNEPSIITVAYSDLTKEAKRQVDCLTENIYHEAGIESQEGKQAVAFVTINRTQDERFPSSICSVVKQKSQRTCQFSWFCTHVKIDKESLAYKESLEAALHVYANYENLKDVTGGALYYHADYVKPRWKGLEITRTIGRHIFYKEGKPYDAKTKSTAI